LPGVTAVEIRSEDLSYIFHPIQRAYANADLHAFLPALDEVQTIVSSFFQRRDGDYPAAAQPSARDPEPDLLTAEGQGCERTQIRRAGRDVQVEE
jgi:hypothetical protein